MQELNMELWTDEVGGGQVFLPGVFIDFLKMANGH